MKRNRQLSEALQKYFGFDSFKEHQEGIITDLLDGKDVFVLMPTGGGKSLCYQLPALIQEGTAIIVSPLIALMKNQVDAIRSTCEEDAVAHFLNSSLTKAAIEQVKQDVIDGKTKMLYVAPESLTKKENIEFLRNIHISFYAIDEAHCISEWGHDFRPEYRRLRSIIEEIGIAPIIALTATATDKVRLDIKKNLGVLDAVEYKSSFNRPNLYYEVRMKKDDDQAIKEIVKYIKKRPNKSGIIYCLSRKTVEEIANILQANGIKAAAYHAGMEATLRSETQDDFLMERIDVIVATIAFGMGIDKPDVRYVIHFNIPKSLEGYYQETGRAGRDGGEGACIAFYSREDLARLEKFMQGKPVAEQEIGRVLLNETAAYAESCACRRKMLLHYFGEMYPKDNCKNCDNCLHPKKQVEAKELLQKLLEVIVALNQHFRDDYIKDILMGNDTDDVDAHKHKALEIFGCGEDQSEQTWNAVIRQALIEGFIQKSVEDYGILSLTDKGTDFLQKPTSFKVAMQKEINDEDIIEPSQSSADSTVAPELFDMLMDLRKKKSNELGVKPYVIFKEPSLQAMATTFPQTIEEMQYIPGVGVGKANRYGKDFCELIKRYCEDNDIDRPEDIRVRTVPKKSKLKVAIIQAIDRKVDFEDIAIANGIETIEELLTELESIVDSGTKINIDYYINEYLDPEDIDEIYTYFEGADSDDIGAAVEELPEFDETHIRLVRIKFLSEMAN